MPPVTDAFFSPAWPLPANVRAVVTQRSGGISAAPFDSNNLATHVGDQSASVAHNRRLLWQQLPGVRSIQWLNQVHGTAVVAACGGTVVPVADAQFTREKGLACAVLTADCLPVLFCAADGSQVAAAHAGWRGLAAGVLLKTLQQFADPEQVLVYLGPAISAGHFEVGAEVKAAFAWASADCFRPGTGNRYFADLYQLARQQLQRAGVVHIHGGEHCTFRDSQQFYSYRRQAVTGRQASLIWRL